MDDVFINEVFDEWGRDDREEEAEIELPCIICGEIKPDCFCMVED